MGTLSMIAASFVLFATGWLPTAAAQGTPNAVGTQPVSTGSAARAAVHRQPAKRRLNAQLSFGSGGVSALYARGTAHADCNPEPE